MFKHLVTDLIGRPGARRDVSLRGDLDIHLQLAEVTEPVTADFRLEATSDGIVARGTVRFVRHLTCNRCLTEWNEDASVEFLEVFEEVDAGGRIDLGQTLLDEVALSLPVAPLCSPDCLGLCPNCGTDLNTNPCSGHPDEVSSPFGALQQLLEP
jgi:uncharacterized protein